MTELKVVPPKRSWFELLSDFLKAILWPSFAFTLLFLYREPLKKSAQLLPELLEKSGALSIGSVSIKLSRDALYQMPPDIRQALNGISVEALRFLLRDNAGPRYSDAQLAQVRPEANGVIGELEDRRLYEKLNIEGVGRVQYRRTRLGDRALNSLIDVFLAPFAEKK